MNMPVADILDRAAIAKLKAERTREDEVMREWKEMEAELGAIGARERWPIWTWFEALYLHHAEIWKHENPLRRGKPGEYEDLDARRADLGEFTDDEIFAAGVCALHVRRNNRKRVEIRNRICRVTRTGFQDIKMNGEADDTIRERADTGSA